MGFLKSQSKREANGMNQVWAVVGGFEYDGECFDSLQLFDCYDEGVEYQKQLENDHYYDYAMIHKKDVNMHSMLQHKV